MALVKCNHCGKETKNDTKKCKWCNKDLDKKLEVIENHFSNPNIKRNSKKEPIIKETVFIEDSKLKTDFSNPTNIIFLIIGIIFTPLGAIAIFDILGSDTVSFSDARNLGYAFIFFPIGLYLIWSSIYESGINEKLNFYIEKNNPVVAKWWKRALSFLIDNCIILIISLPFYSATFGFEIANLEVTGVSIYGDPYTEYILYIPNFGVVAIFYYSLLESIFQRTIGKMVLNLRVISMKSDKLSFSQIFIRTFSRCIQPIDVWYCVLSKNPIALHDVSSKTLVIDNS